MKYRIIFSRLSFSDFESIAGYYYELNKKTSQKYYTGILKQIKQLKQFPHSGRIIPEFEDIHYDKYRELIYEYFRIIYRVEGEEIIIVRIIDGRKLLDLDIINGENV